MLARFLLLIVFVPLIELLLLLELTKRTNLVTTILVVITTGVVGMSLVRWQGIKAWKSIQTELSAGRSPSEPIVSGVMILIAGALLLTPGLLTDTVGFLLLVPSVRRIIFRVVQKQFLRGMSSRFRSSVWVSTSGSSMDASPFGVAPDVDEKFIEPPEEGQAQVRVVDPDQPRNP